MALDAVAVGHQSTFLTAPRNQGSLEPGHVLTIIVMADDQIRYSAFFYRISVFIINKSSTCAHMYMYKQYILFYLTVECKHVYIHKLDIFQLSYDIFDETLILIAA